MRFYKIAFPVYLQSQYLSKGDPELNNRGKGFS